MGTHWVGARVDEEEEEREERGAGEEAKGAIQEEERWREVGTGRK